MRVWLILGALFGFSGVAIGAFGAHGLKSLPAEALANYETAARYQMYHAFALLVVGLLLRDRRSRLLHVGGAAFLAGILIFSGSLYALSLTGMRTFGMITPVGGLGFLAGWLLLAVASLRHRRPAPLPPGP